MENNESIISSSTENNQENHSDDLPSYNPGKGIIILGGIIAFFGCLSILIPLIHILSEGFKGQYTPVIIVGIFVMLIGIGLMRRNYWAWIASFCIFALSVASNIFLIATRHDPKAISNAILPLIALIALANFKDQIKRKQ